ncbi:N-acetyltransferase family protein [Oceanicola sp. D3]|uniref:GNAT family N-acetyltransferase n=1 Tax=Oceanicola sp. D3 TaxID=2587163 RepID=UPI00111D9349|nr:GNAT family N-acetyltransferase [Oceanicola sp. D3]QDC09003.1 N-acetyltransferase family protein [Oceanicola sp. D3]
MAEVRRAAPEDAGPICELINWVVRETVVTFNSVEKVPDEIAAAMEQAPFWVTEQAGRVVGYASYGPFRGGVGYGRTKEHSIAVRPEAWGRGAGRALMAALCAHASAAGVHSLFAGVSGENEAGARFHAALGFQEVARLRQVGWKFDRWHDLVLMQKFL